MTLDALITRLQELRTSETRGLLSVTATGPGLDQLRPVDGAFFAEVGGADRVSLVVEDS